MFCLKDFLLQFILQVADADDELVGAGLDFGLGEGVRVRGGEVGGEGLEYSHFIIDTY